MTCENECEKLSIIQGEDRDFFVRITDECSGDNYDLTGLTAAKAIFKGTTANVEATLAASEIAIVTPAENGKIQVFLSDAKTALLKTGTNQPIELELTFGADKRIIKLSNVLTVTARI